MNIFNLFHVLSLVSLQTIGKTVNNNKVATLGNIHYAHSYNKTKTAVSDRIHSTKNSPLDTIAKKLQLTKIAHDKNFA